LEAKGVVLADIADYVAGHSLGEYSALCAAGSLSIADTARLLQTRGRSMQQAVPVGEGAMAAILGLELSEVEEVAAAAAQANTSTFKANPADLYSNRQNKLQITGVTTNQGALSLSPSDLYFGIKGQTAKGGALPQISDYEQLYGYRDTEIGKSVEEREQC